MDKCIGQIGESRRPRPHHNPRNSLIRLDRSPHAGVAELADARDLKLARLADHTRSHRDFTNEFLRALEIVRAIEGRNWRGVAREWPAGFVADPGECCILQGFVAPQQADDVVEQLWRAI